MNIGDAVTQWLADRVEDVDPVGYNFLLEPDPWLFMNLTYHGNLSVI